MSLDTGLSPAGEEPYAGEWECMECGYVEAGSKRQPPRKCPDCGAPSQALEFFPYRDDEDASQGEAQDESPDDDLDLDASSNVDEEMRDR